MKPSVTLPACLAATLLFASIVPAHAEDAELPRNLGGGWKKLQAQQAEALKNRQGQTPATPVAHSSRIQQDAIGRVVVDVYLDGTVPLETVQAALSALGGNVLGVEKAGHSLPAQNGVISLQLPPNAAAAAAKLPGVRSVDLVHRPWRRAGVLQSQGVLAIRANNAQVLHYTGTGITVGVISDSYDQTAPHAAKDVRNDDLPGVGNVAGRKQPVVVLADGDPGDPTNTDEGRAMLEIVHDVAPNSKLAFCAVGMTQTTFADAIRRLRTDPSANCDIIVDDIVFPKEPMFSRGMVEQAVEDVTTSTSLAGKQVFYYSAAGNQGDLGYEADFSPISDATARADTNTLAEVHLGTVPSDLTGGGFHNFGSNTNVQLVRKITVTDALPADEVELNLQWNDLFDPHQMTSDYKILVFDADGNYQASLSGVDDSITMGEAVQLAELPPNVNGSERDYKVMIAKSTEGTGQAMHFRCIADSEAAVIGGDFLQEEVPTIVGHSGALHCDGIAAHQYNHPGRAELFSSYGPVTEYFDENGNRLSVPEVRQQPTMAGPDGVATTIFRPFFGTSAAAPHVAAAAALMLQATGGPGTTTAAAVRLALQQTAFAHDLDPDAATATKTFNGCTVTLSGHGDDSDAASDDPNFFDLEFDGPAGSRLKSIFIDLGPAGLRFDPTKAKGFPFTIGSASGGVTTDIRTALTTGITPIGDTRLNMVFDQFPPGGSLTFGIDRDFTSTRSDGNSADYLVNGMVTINVILPGATKAVPKGALFVNHMATGTTRVDGYGLINVNAAIRALLATP